MTDPRVEKPSNLNLPNILTTLRIVLVPFFGVALLIDGRDSITWRLVAFGIFVVAMVTDGELEKLECLADEQNQPLSTVVYELLAAALKRKR